jgi:hypothetical protein
VGGASSTDGVACLDPIVNRVMLHVSSMKDCTGIKVSIQVMRRHRTHSSTAVDAWLGLVCTCNRRGLECMGLRLSAIGTLVTGFRLKLSSRCPRRSFPQSADFETSETRSRKVFAVYIYQHTCLMLSRTRATVTLYRPSADSDTSSVRADYPSCQKVEPACLPREKSGRP